MKKIKTLVVQIGYYGLGYPPGYRPLDIDVSFKWDDARWYLYVETSKSHKDNWHSEVENDASDRFPHPGTCDPNLVQLAYWDESGMYRVILDVEELSIEHIEQAVRLFLRAHDTEAESIKFVWQGNRHSLDEEPAIWKRDHDQYLGWLKKAAPAYKVSFAGSAVEDLLKLTKGDKEETALMEDMGFTQDSKNKWTKKPELVVHEPREWYVAALKNLAQKLGDPGPLFLSTGSWPTSVSVVANGRRYSIVRKEKLERAWYGYLSTLHCLILFRSCTDVEVIYLEGEPDILSALTEEA